MSHTGEAWRRGRRKTLVRDNHRCQDCGSKENSVHVHHIRRPEEFDSEDAAHHPSNLVTLCKYCHKGWEGINARPILLGGGVSNHEVVAELVEHDLQREVYDALCGEVHNRLIWENGNICDECGERIPAPGPSIAVSADPIESLHKVISRVAKIGLDEYGDIDDIFPRGRAIAETSPRTCKDCVFSDKLRRKRGFMKRYLRQEIYRLQEEDIPVHKWDAEDMFEDLTHDRSKQGMPEADVFNRSLTAGIKRALEERDHIDAAVTAVREMDR